MIHTQSLSPCQNHVVTHLCLVCLGKLFSTFYSSSLQYFHYIQSSLNQGQITKSGDCDFWGDKLKCTMDHCQWDSGVTKGQLCVFSLSAYQLINWMKNPPGPKHYCRQCTLWCYKRSNCDPRDVSGQYVVDAAEMICKYNEASRCCPPLVQPWAKLPLVSSTMSNQKQNLRSTRSAPTQSCLFAF